MVQVDYIIVGQGIAGILVAFGLRKEGKSVWLYDQGNKNSASRVSGAVLNPVNLKNGHAAFPVDSQRTAIETYRGLEQFLGVTLIHKKPLIFFPGQESADSPFILELDAGEKAFFNKYFRNGWDARKVQPVWQIGNNALLIKWAEHFQGLGNFRRERFRYADCVFHENEISYQDIIASKIIFCEGADGRDNPFFPQLPFTKNRGDVLMLSIPELPPQYIYHFGNRLIPLRDQQFWLGSNYQWELEGLKPDVLWRQKTLIDLKSWLKLPFQVMEHNVSERPTAVGQKPFLLQHEALKNVFLFNGLGTKGFTLGPYFAKAFLKLLDEF